jgi:hypothetical protein
MSNITVGSYLSKVLYLGIKVSNLFFLLVIKVVSVVAY